MGEPGFWDDQGAAARISREHARVTRQLDTYERLSREYEDARELYELEPDLGDEVEAQLEPLRRELAKLQEDALFTGEYDSGDAVLSINAGTGGTDAQDWAEMMLRMYLRWAAGRGYQTELIEASPGEEAGIKSATVTMKGENAYGVLKAERGVHRLVRHSPFDSDSAVRITHLPTGIVVQCQNERSQLSNKQTALRILRSRLAELQEQEREAELAKERGAAQDIGFGSQIRSYVMHPYQMVKDHRTDFEVGNIQSVFDGALDGFVRAYLLKKAADDGAAGNVG